MALLSGLVPFAHLLAGFSNRDLVQQVSPQLTVPYSRRKATYDLRRL